MRLESYGASVLVVGPSGSGKSTTILGILERLVERGYQFCLVDPEGDHGEFEAAAALGSTAGAPTPDEVLQVLQNPTQSVVVSLTGVSLEDRPAFLTGLLPRLQELRAGTGRPHWIIIDEAHHVLPSVRGAAPQTVPQQLDSLALITLEPHRVARAALRPVDVVVAVGERPGETFADFAAVVGSEAPAMPSEPAEPGTVWAWEPRSGERPLRVRLPETRTEMLRHRRKYAEGDVGEGRSFYFRGPEGKLNLRAQNLMLFLQMADGVDDDTWMFHLRNGDYSRWFGEMLKDPELAEEAARYEQDSALSPSDSRKRIAEAILDRYTAPA